VAGLADLLVHAEQVVPAERLVDDLWRGEPPRAAAATLQTYVKNLRRLLEPGRAARARRGVLQTVRSGYVLHVQPDAVDSWRAARLTEQGRAALAAGGPAEASDRLEAALSLWTGPAFGELADEAYLRGEAARLEELRIGALETRVQADLALGRHVELCGELEAAVDDHLFRERLWGQWMLALYRAGRQVDALRAYQRLRRLLDTELGIEPGQELRDLEEAILLQKPELDWLGLPEGATVRIGSAAGGPGAVRHNLPADLTRFIRRAEEQHAVDELLQGSRLVTLTGVGGVGKTRLALRVASSAIDRYPDGVWLSELAPVSDSNGILSPLAASLGVAVRGSDSQEDVDQLVCTHLANRRVLLVFDNCEHLVDGVARAVHTVLTSCPHVTVLATSREILRVPGEVTLMVPPMSLPADRSGIEGIASADAVVLFCERAGAAQPPFVLGADNADFVARICRRLDGIPLALELTAARMRMLSLDQIVDRLDDYFRLLTGGARTDRPRHQTLRAALDWSHDLLSDAEQVVLRRLSVFPDRFDLDAAAALVELGDSEGSASGGDLDGADLVGQLVDKSLVVLHTADGEHRYRLLEPVRQYASEKLTEADEVEAARRRHRDVFLTRLEAWRSEWDGLSFDFMVDRRVRTDLANLRAAMVWSWAERELEAALRLLVVQFPFWFWTGSPDALEWLERVLAEAEPADHRDRAIALARLALTLHDSEQTDPEREVQLGQEAVAMAERLDDDTAVVFTTWALAELYVGRGDTAEARSLLEHALHRSGHDDYSRAAGWLRVSLGWIAVAMEQPEEARANFERAAELAAAGSGNPLMAAHALAALAPPTVLLGETERELQLADRALAGARSTGLPHVVVMALAGAADTTVVAGVPARAEAALQRLLRALRDQAGVRWIADALETAALVLESKGAGDAAAEALGSAHELRAGTGTTVGGIRVISPEIRRASNRLEEALSAGRFTVHFARARTRSPGAAITEVLARLDDDQLASAGAGSA
jgi:predicted ATPase/DNA-binding SARP family transcriptional activator